MNDNDKSADRLDIGPEIIKRDPMTQELLEVLKEVVALSDRKHIAWDKAHAAIAKAEGVRPHITTDINDRLRAFLKGHPGVRHAKLECKCTNSWYHGRSTRRGGQWQEEYTCPECGRKGKFLRNYLGQRKLICDGIRFTKEVI